MANPAVRTLAKRIERIESARAAREDEKRSAYNARWMPLLSDDDLNYLVSLPKNERGDEFDLASWTPDQTDRANQIYFAAQAKMLEAEQ